MNARAFRIDPRDNVATLLDDIEGGPLSVFGEAAEALTVTALEPISRGHKIALSDLTPGEAILKFGTRIGSCTKTIRKGSWVHLHNLASDLDERSAQLDLHTGAANDHASAYE